MNHTQLTTPPQKKKSNFIVLCSGPKLSSSKIIVVEFDRDEWSLMINGQCQLDTLRYSTTTSKRIVLACLKIQVHKTRAHWHRHKGIPEPTKHLAFVIRVMLSFGKGKYGMCNQITLFPETASSYSLFVNTSI